MEHYTIDMLYKTACLSVSAIFFLYLGRLYSYGDSFNFYECQNIGSITLTIGPRLRLLLQVVDSNHKRKFKYD